jgi:hypothetical protein
MSIDASQLLVGATAGLLEPDVGEQQLVEQQHANVADVPAGAQVQGSAAVTSSSTGACRLLGSPP